RSSAEGEKDQTEHVERGEQRGEQPEAVENAAARCALKGGEQNRILREKAGERRETGDGHSRGQHGCIGPAYLFAEAAHFVHVLLAADGMNHGAGSKKEQGLEERVRHSMENARGERA